MDLLMSPKQGELFGNFPLEYGGEKSLGRRKTMRPFDRKRAVHATLRASKAVGRWSMNQMFGSIALLTSEITSTSF